MLASTRDAAAEPKGIHWPLGKKETIKLPEVDRIYTVTEGTGITGALCGARECEKNVRKA